MNKRIFILILITILLLLTIVYIVDNKPKKLTIPDFSFYTLNGNEFTQQDIENGENVFIYINTECKICEYEMSKLQIIQDSIFNYNIYLVSGSNSSDLEKLLTQYDIFSIPNVTVLLDKEFKFEEFFMTNMTPSSFIYDSNHILIKSFQGVSETDKFFDYLLKHNCE